MPPKIQDLQALWRRSLITRPNGVRDDTTEVRWLQGTEVYIDLRQPAGLPDFSGRRGIADLSIADCRALARQEGFAGRLTFDGTFFAWGREIDFQPRSLYADVGSLRWEGEILVEQGRDVDYIEHWHRDTSAQVAPATAVMLREIDGPVRAALLCVGSVFMWARDRAIVPPAHKTLLECITEAAVLSAARTLIDCDISFGTIDAGELRITASTLPYRIGDRLKPQASGRRVTIRDRAGAGTSVARHWEIMDMEGDLGEITVPTPASGV